MVVTGSLHQTGTHYAWWGNFHPRDHAPAECPTWLINLLQAPPPRTGADYAALIAGTTVEGERRFTLLSIAGHLISNLVPIEVTQEFWPAGRRSDAAHRCRRMKSA